MAALGAGCAARAAQTPLIRGLTFGVTGGAIHGVAGDADATFHALAIAGDTGAPRTAIEARRAGVASWRTELDGSAGRLALARAVVVATVSGTQNAGGGAVLGEPGVALVALDRERGSVRWRATCDASEWVVVTAVASMDDGVLVAGSFSGTLRIGRHVVSSAGKTDGFIAKLTATGSASWLVRVGGGGADAIQGVASSGRRIAIAGVFAPGGELRGVPLEPIDARTPFADGFVAELDDAGARRWSATFGTKLDDAVAGVAIDGGGRVVVAATTRDAVQIGGAQLQTRGGSDGLVGWWSPDGSSLHAVLIGGDEPDGLQAIAAAGEHVVVGGYFSGSMPLGARSVTAGGGDDAFLATLDERGSVLTSWQVTGEGREEVAVLASIPGGVVAGISHTAGVTVAETTIAAPADPMTGAAVVVIPVH
ncbi:MAG: hypothetical protein AB7P03_18890 [Kofleriaceae bacterium]